MKLTLIERIIIASVTLTAIAVGAAVGIFVVMLNADVLFAPTDEELQRDIEEVRQLERERVRAYYARTMSSERYEAWLEEHEKNSDHSDLHDGER